MKLLEKDMEELIIQNPKRYLNETDLKLISRQYSIGSYRFDLLFQDRHKGRIIVEIQRGTLDRNHTYKILDYFDEFKEKNPNTFIDLIIVANKITRERRARLNSYGISFFEIPESTFFNDPNWSKREQIKSQNTPSKLNDSNQKKIILDTNHQQTDSTRLSDKMRSIFAKKIEGKISREQIINKVLDIYPGTNQTSVIPSDYCYNIINKAPFSFKIHLFESLGGGYYNCLGENYHYNGNIYWKNSIVGSWINGKPVLKLDPRE